MLNFTQFAAIDPLALMVPGNIYNIVAERNHPHTPSVTDVREAARSLTKEERAFVVARAKVLAAYAQVVVEAVG